MISLSYLLFSYLSYLVTYYLVTLLSLFCWPSQANNGFRSELTWGKWYHSVLTHTCVTLDKSLNLSKSQLPPLQSEETTKLVYVLNEIIYVDCIPDSLADGGNSVDEWIKQLWYIYTMEYYSAIKKEENFTLCNSMDGPGEHYAKWNKPVRERQIPYDFIHM